MHEMSLAGGILQVVEDAARRDAFGRVSVLRLSVPALAGVEVAALRFALDALAPGTLLDGAEVEIDEPAGKAWCLHCSRLIQVNRRGEPCPHCGSWQIQVTEGTELRVVEMLVE